MRMRNLVGILGMLGLVTALFLPVSESVPVVSLGNTQASVFQDWVQVNLAAMQAPDATFQSVEKELSTPVRVAALDGGQKYFRSDGCSTGCSSGCSVGCSSGCSSGCSNGCSYGCR